MAQTYLSFVVTAACFCDFHKADDWAADKGSAIFCWDCLWDRLSQGKNWLFDHWKYLDGQTYWLLITNHVWCLTMSDPNKYQPMDIPGYVYKASYTIAPGDHPSSTPRVFFFLGPQRGFLKSVHNAIPEQPFVLVPNGLVMTYVLPQASPLFGDQLILQFLFHHPRNDANAEWTFKKPIRLISDSCKDSRDLYRWIYWWCKSKDAEVQLLRVLPQVQPGCWSSMLIAGWKKA